MGGGQDYVAVSSQDVDIEAQTPGEVLYDADVDTDTQDFPTDNEDSDHNAEDPSVPAHHPPLLSTLVNTAPTSGRNKEDMKIYLTILRLQAGYLLFNLIWFMARGPGPQSPGYHYISSAVNIWVVIGLASNTFSAIAGDFQDGVSEDALMCLFGTVTLQIFLLIFAYVIGIRSEYSGK